MLVVLAFVLVPQTKAVELDNLELVFKKTYLCRGFPDSLASFGQSISSAGDINGDGYDDIIVGSAYWDADSSDWRSRGIIFFGGDPMDTIPDVILTGDISGESGWVEVAWVGDVNRDGLADVVLSNHGTKAVRLFFGGSPMDTVCDMVLMNDVDYSLANSVSWAGDVNGDGYDDIIVGDYMTGNLDGSAAVFFGGPLLDGTADVILRGHRHEGFGMQVAGGGDLNCDGYDDVVVGEWVNSESAPDAGKIYIFFGGNPMDTIPDVWMYGEGAGQGLGWFGLDVVRVDGMCDWVVAGTEFYPDGFPSHCPGKVYMLFGGRRMDGVPDVWMLGRTDSTSLGICSASAGRVVESGFDGVLSGAVNGNSLISAAYLWLSGVPFDTVPDGVASQSSAGEDPGWRVASAGDVNSDGHDEVMFSNYASHDTFNTVWVCKYTGTGVAEDVHRRAERHRFSLVQNYPNPFSSSTLVRFRIPPGDVRTGTVDILDAAGGHVKRLWSGSGPNPGKTGSAFAVRWDGTDESGNRMSSGVYFCTLRAGVYREVRKMILLR
jgi:hypothetical protein